MLSVVRYLLFRVPSPIISQHTLWCLGGMQTTKEVRISWTESEQRISKAWQCATATRCSTSKTPPHLSATWIRSRHCYIRLLVSRVVLQRAHVAACNSETTPSTPTPPLLSPRLRLLCSAHPCGPMRTQHTRAVIRRHRHARRRRTRRMVARDTPGALLLPPILLFLLLLISLR